MLDPTDGENDVTDYVKSLHKEAAKLTKEMHKLEASGADNSRISAVYARLVEIESELWS